MIDAIFAGLRFFLVVSGAMLWCGGLIFLIIYVMENEGVQK